MSIVNLDLDSPADTALGRGIKHIGIGKYGSKPLSAELLAECRAALEDPMSHPLQRGAFLGALIAKGPTPAEMTLEDVIGKGAFSHPTFFINKVCPDLPIGMHPIATKLVRGHNLQISEAHQLGDYLFGDGDCETFRGLAASILRVRHETNEEYLGLMRAAEQTYSPGFAPISCADRPLIQLAEPFDGVDNSYLITPLLGQFFQKRGYGAVSMVGRSGGPKFTLNALDLYMHMGCQFLQSNHELDTPLGRYGWVLDQKALSPALNHWVDRRHTIIKRPFLATLEKVLNPCHAQILVTSVFHITYQMKMAELALMAGFDAAIVLKRGLEGSLAPSTSRSTGILCAVRTPRGHMFHQNFEGDSSAFTAFRTESDVQYENPLASDNARLVQRFMDEGQTNNADFDNRVHFAHALYGRGLDWVEAQLQYTN
ncbi:anthranilate phosphoribosyltransferase [Spirosoma oryzicola]|uniref:anthranilate phosphoribosyltransferase n=1 Tax=Spirosoma oryzicola TaxID=2898794 RepID=UPI001E422865|nr:anthranilate phosphoribosyltransferase [Spirosoma oryzicola]UHG91579.1 anthranilate phosphoribosyltransferase [Spirosoma oryzicola]